MPQAVPSIGESIHRSNRFPSLQAGLLQFQRPTSVWNAMNANGWLPRAARLLSIPILLAGQISGHNECNLRVGVQSIHEKTQVVLVNEEAKRRHRWSFQRSNGGRIRCHSKANRVGQAVR
jgi:hypothetical protein